MRFLFIILLIGFLIYYFKIVDLNNFFSFIHPNIEKKVNENLRKEIIKTRSLIKKAKTELDKLKNNINKNNEDFNFFEEKDNNLEEPEELKNSDDLEIKTLNILEDIDKILKSSE